MLLLLRLHLCGFAFTLAASELARSAVSTKQHAGEDDPHGAVADSDKWELGVDGASDEDFEDMDTDLEEIDEFDLPLHSVPGRKSWGWGPPRRRIGAAWGWAPPRRR